MEQVPKKRETLMNENLMSIRIAHRPQAGNREHDYRSRTLLLSGSGLRESYRRYYVCSLARSPAAIDLGSGNASHA
jgi:hypothetical protein